MCLALLSRSGLIYRGSFPVNESRAIILQVLLWPDWISDFTAFPCCSVLFGHGTPWSSVLYPHLSFIGAILVSEGLFPRKLCPEPTLYGTSCFSDRTYVELCGTSGCPPGILAFSAAGTI